MNKATTTVNPLHFEDLDPHRFEDLIRQLLYDFRSWSSLEATGRSGSDDGFDARGWEVIPPDEELLDDEEERTVQPKERLWLVQCKRERQIGPNKIIKYLDEVLKNNNSIYGIIFAAPCDFSKKARDNFREKCRDYKLSECHLWGKAELEDMLFQPHNDNLLFAYFGISLSIRKRSLKSKINARLTVKRKTIKCLGDINYNSFQPVLLRDPSENRYPSKKEIANFDSHPLWKSYYFVGHHHNGLVFLTRKFFAYIEDDRQHWDYVEQFDESRPHLFRAARRVTPDEEKRNEAHTFWLKIPEKNRAWLEIRGVVLYDNIIAIDEVGDNIYFQMPQIYVTFTNDNGPFEHYYYAILKLCQSFASRDAEPKDDMRIKYFPDKY